MKRFTRLYREIDEASQPAEKIAALESYFRDAAPVDAAWALQLLCGQKPPRSVTAAELRAWAIEEIDLSPWLFDECQETVGDLAETIALLLPEIAATQNVSLHESVEMRLLPLRSATEATRKDLVRQTWRESNAPERFVWNKLITGGFRVAVTEAQIVRALANVANVEPAIMAHRLASEFQPTAEAFQNILKAESDARPEIARPYPFCRAASLEIEASSLGDLSDWQVEWKWGGIRAQLIRRQDAVLLWSSGNEMVSAAFPEIIEAGRLLPEGTVLDGQILVWRDGATQPFRILQRRLGRKSVSAELRSEAPVIFVVHDLLEYSGEDWRLRPLVERRGRLERVVTAAMSGASGPTPIGETPDMFATISAPRIPPALRLSELLERSSWIELTNLYKEARKRHVDGLMLKRRSSIYGAGKQGGDWWEWNVDPLLIDAVLIGAQAGSGGRASLYIDYTFGVWHEGKLTAVAKANAGLGDAEILEVDAYVRANTTGKFGPMRAVKPELIFELAFDTVEASTRHKCGLVLRSPRINRWRRDKNVEEAATLETLRALLA